MRRLWVGLAAAMCLFVLGPGSAPAMEQQKKPVTIPEESRVCVDCHVKEKVAATAIRITSYNVCYTKLLRVAVHADPALLRDRGLLFLVTHRHSAARSEDEQEHRRGQPCPQSPHGPLLESVVLDRVVSGIRCR